MKKHDEKKKKKKKKKKKGTTESVSSKNCVKERKAKPKEMTNIVRNT